MEFKERQDQLARDQQELAARFSKPVSFQPVDPSWHRLRKPGNQLDRGRSWRHRLTLKYVGLYGQCYWCGVIRTSRAWSTLDHLIPVCKGGTNIHQNLVLSCGPCNTAKADLMPHDFLPRRPELILQINEAIRAIDPAGKGVTALMLPDLPRGAVISVLWQHFRVKLPHGYLTH